MMSKRLFDLLLSSLGLLILGPAMLLIALAVKLDSPGPVFFRQERVGRGGRPFFIHKFRTMRVDAPSLGPQITVGADARITRFKNHDLQVLAAQHAVYDDAAKVMQTAQEARAELARLFEMDRLEEESDKV